MDWKYYVPSGCHWVSGNSIVELRVCYKWDTPNKTKRTVKFYSKIALYEKNYNFQIRSGGANRNNGWTGFNILMSINSGGTVNGNSTVINESLNNVYTHEIELCSTSTTLKYDDNGKVTPKINYDLYFKWYYINQGSIDKLDAKGTYTVKDVTSISTVDITSIKLGKTSLTTNVVPNKISFSNIDKTTQSINSGNTIIYKSKINSYAKKNSDITFTISPAAAKGTLSLSSSNTKVITVTNTKIDVAKANKFTVSAIAPGTATVTVKSNNNKSAKLTCTVSANNSVSWSSSNTAVATVSSGTVTAKKDVNGTTNIKAYASANTSASNTVITNVLLPPNSVTITANKTEIYPGETVKYDVAINPYNGSNVNKSVSSTYRASNYFIYAGFANGSKTPLKNAITSTTNPFSIYYTFNNYTLPTNKLITEVVSVYGEGKIKGTNTLIVKPPKLTVDKNYIGVEKDGEAQNVTITTVPANRPYTYSYNNEYINVTKINASTLAIKGKKDIDNTILTITDTGPIVNDIMTHPYQQVNVTVGVVPVNQIWFTGKPSNITDKLSCEGVGFTDKYENNLVYSSDILRKQPYTFYDTEAGPIYSIIGYESKRYSVSIEYSPANAFDSLMLSATNPTDMSVESDVVGIDPRSKNILLNNNNGNVTATLYLMKPGKANLIVKSLNKGITVSIPIIVQFENDVNVVSNSLNIANIVQNVSKTDDGNCAKHNVLKSEFNGKTVVEVRNRTGSVQKTYSLAFNRLLTPKKLTLKSDINRIYVGDKVNLSFLLEPYNTNLSNKSVATSLRNVNITFKTDKGTQFSQLTFKQICDKSWIYTIPDLALFKTEGTKYISITAYVENFENVKSEIKLYFNVKLIYVDGTSENRKLYLATTNKSYKNYSIEVFPDTETYAIGPSIKESDGCLVSLQKNSIKIYGTSYRNLTYKNAEATKQQTVYTADGKFDLNNVRGKTINVEYAGSIAKSEVRPKVDIEVFTCKYFDTPKVLNITETNRGKFLNYFGELPKIIIELPDYNDFDSLDDIIISFANGKTYYAKTDANYFSFNYNTNKHLHTAISSAIVDYNYKGFSYCIFIPPEKVINGNVTVTYVSKFNTIPNSSITFSITKQTLPILPKVGDPISRDNIVSYIKAIETTLLPFYTNKNNLFKQKSIVDTLYGISSSNPDSIGRVGTKIKSIMFFKLLFALYKTLFELENAANYMKMNDKLPERFHFLPNRNMLVTDKLRRDWYRVGVESDATKNLRDINLYKDCLSYGIDLTEPLTSEYYPIMVDDSNDYIGNPIYKIINDYKSTELYNDYTISPLTEIIKVLKQL